MNGFPINPLPERNISLAALASLAVTLCFFPSAVYATAVFKWSEHPTHPDTVEPVLTHLMQSGYADGPCAILYDDGFDPSYQCSINIFMCTRPRFRTLPCSDWIKLKLLCESAVLCSVQVGCLLIHLFLIS